MYRLTFWATSSLWAGSEVSHAATKSAPELVGSAIFCSFQIPVRGPGLIGGVARPESSAGWSGQKNLAHAGPGRGLLLGPPVVHQPVRERFVGVTRSDIFMAAPGTPAAIVPPGGPATTTTPPARTASCGRPEPTGRPQRTVTRCAAGAPGRSWLPRRPGGWSSCSVPSLPVNG